MAHDAAGHVHEAKLGRRFGDSVTFRVDGRMHPDCTDYWDGNWLVSPISLRAGRGLRVVIPAGLRAEELRGLLVGLERMEETRGGSVTLDPMEPWLRLTIAIAARGQLTITGECAKAGEGYYATRFELVGLD